MTTNFGNRTGREILIKTAVTHTVTYFIMGVLAFITLDYAHLYRDTALKYFMRPTTDRLVIAGPLFQPIRGLIFGVAFVILQQSFFEKKRGWLTMWLVLVCLSIVSTFGPSPASVEGLIYTTLPLRLHIIGLPEVLLQSFLLAFVVFHWVISPKKWIGWVMGSFFVLVLLVSTLGLLHGGRN